MIQAATYPKLSISLISELEKNNRNFHFVGDKTTGLHWYHKNGLLNNRKMYVVTRAGVAVGYAIFTEFTHLQAKKYMVQEGDDVTTLPTKYKKVLFLDVLEVARGHQHLGLGTVLLQELKKYKLPILLQITADSEGFWWKQGFRRITNSNWSILDKP